MVIFAASMEVVTGNSSSIDENKMETEGIAKQLGCVWLRLHVRRGGVGSVVVARVGREERR